MQKVDTFFFNSFWFTVLFICKFLFVNCFLNFCPIKLVCMDHLTKINFARYKTSQVNHIKSKQTNGSYGKTQIITLLQSLIGYRQFLGTVLDLLVFT